MNMRIDILYECLSSPLDLQYHSDRPCSKRASCTSLQSEILLVEKPRPSWFIFSHMKFSLFIGFVYLDTRDLQYPLKLSKTAGFGLSCLSFPLPIGPISATAHTYMSGCMQKCFSSGTFLSSNLRGGGTAFQVSRSFLSDSSWFLLLLRPAYVIGKVTRCVLQKHFIIKDALYSDSTTTISMAEVLTLNQPIKLASSLSNLRIGKRNLLPNIVIPTSFRPCLQLPQICFILSPSQAKCLIPSKEAERITAAQNYPHMQAFPSSQRGRPPVG